MHPKGAGLCLIALRLCRITEYLAILLYRKFIILRKSLSSRQTLGLWMARPPPGQSPASAPLATY